MTLKHTPRSSRARLRADARRLCPARLACLVPLVWLLACDADKPEDTPAESTKSPGKAPDARAKPKVAPDADPMKSPELITNKLGPYFSCVNTTRPLVSRHYQRYSARVGGDGTLPRKSKAPTPAPLPSAAFGACERALREGPHLSPELPILESAAKIYDERARAYQTLAADATAAIEKRDKKAVKAGHEGLVAAYDSWDTANIELTKLLDDLQASADKDYLARIEARAGKGAEYLSHDLVIAGRGFAHCLASLDAATGCKEALSRLERAHDAFSTYRASTAGVDDKVTNLAAYAKLATTYVETARGVSAALQKDPEALDPIAAALATYGKMVGQSRQLDFSALGEG